MRKIAAILLTVATNFVSTSISAHELKGLQKMEFSGRVTSGQTFERKFDGMIFQLAPEGSGFKISILDQNKPHADAHSDLSWLTLPLHGLTDRDIQPSDFRNEDNSDINTGSVNRPQLVRKFVFARGAGADLDKYEQSHGASGLENKPDGSGSFIISHLDLINLRKGTEPKIKSMDFRVTLRWSGKGH